MQSTALLRAMLVLAVVGAAAADLWSELLSGPGPSAGAVPASISDTSSSAGPGTSAPIRGWASLATLSPGSTNPCGIYALDGNRAYGWGRQLSPSGLLANYSQPTAIPSQASWAQLTSGHYLNSTTGWTDDFTCGLQADGSAWCWGSDYSSLGLLGAEAPSWTDVPGMRSARYSVEPLPVGEVDEAGSWVALSCGEGFCCGIKPLQLSFAAWCWGCNDAAQLGCGLMPAQLSSTAKPCQVNSTAPWLGIAAGFGKACGIQSEGALQCWGGLMVTNGTLDAVISASPVLTVERDVVSVAIGGDETCVVFFNSSAACFSAPTCTSSPPTTCFSTAWPPTLVPVPGNHRWKSITVGRDHKCGLTTNSEVMCWGQNRYGQCGSGTASLEPLAAPALIAAEAFFVQVEAGDRFSCACTYAGDLYCWGGYSDENGPTANYTVGELGQGTFRNSAVPVLVETAGIVPFDSLVPADSEKSSTSFGDGIVPPDSPAPAPADSEASFTNVGAIVGGVVGGLAVAAAAGGCVYWAFKRRAAPGAVSLAGSDDKLESGDVGKEACQPGSSVPTSSGGVDEPGLVQHKAAPAAGSSGSAGTIVIPAAWQTDFVRNDQLLSWISTHPKSSAGSSAAASGSGAAGSGTPGATAGGSSDASRSGTVLALTDPLQEATATGIGSAEAPAAAAAAAAVPAAAAAAGGHARQASRSSRAASTPMSGRLLDISRFEVPFFDLKMKRVIGRGSFGKVYLASLNHTAVAVKILLSQTGSSGSDSEQPATLSSPALRELYKETQLTAALSHPNIVTLMGFCTYPPAIITEYCSRGSLIDVLQRGREDPAAAAQLTWRRRLEMALDAAKGMLALHAHVPPILHRDLKGPNLLVDDSWCVKVTDFNLSKVLEAEGSLQSTQSPVNPRWLAPEILKGARASVQTDVFSFGVVMWELLTWQIPWAGVDFWEIVSSLMRGDRLAIPAREALPGPDTAAFAGLDGYCALLARCCAHAPRERPEFAAIIPELRGLLEAAPR